MSLPLAYQNQLFLARTNLLLACLARLLGTIYRRSQYLGYRLADHTLTSLRLLRLGSPELCRRNLFAAEP